MAWGGMTASAPPIVATPRQEAEGAEVIHRAVSWFGKERPPTQRSACCRPDLKRRAWEAVPIREQRR
jgi:hypothetical protein